MKKARYLLLALVMCLSLCACNNGTGNDNTTNNGENPDEHTHVWSDWETISSATCTSDGQKQHTCSCGEIETEWIPATGHNEVIDEAVVASCTENGLTEGKHCANCGEIFVAQETIPAKHQYVDMMCVNCGAEQPISTGFYFEKNSDGESYTLASVGTCEDTEIVIPSTYKDCPVTSIGDSAFFGTSITNVYIPNSITSIGWGAFQSCQNITSVDIPDSVTSIGSYAFSFCTNLTNIDIPNSVSSIGDNAFFECSSLQNIEFPEGLATIKFRICGECCNLKNIIIPDGATYIGSNAFSGCSSLESVTIPGSISSLESGQFGGCNNLTDIYYNGTYECWNRVCNASEVFGSSLNYTVHCTDGDYSRYE